MNELLLLRQRHMMSSSDPYIDKPLTLKFIGNTTIYFVVNDDTVVMYYNKNGSGWNTLIKADDLICSTGDAIQLKANITDRLTAGWAIYTTGNDGDRLFDMEGNILSIVYGDDFRNHDTLGDRDLYNAFYHFYGLCDITNLRIPVVSVGNYALFSAFKEISTVNGDIKNLLPATTIGQRCYLQMFDGCTSLTTVPDLPATTMLSYCYYGMFQNCTSITESPVLPATKLVSLCYTRMFDQCSSLRKITAYFTTTPSTSYCRFWVRGVASSGTFVKSTAASWNVTGTSGVPSGWTIERVTP